MTILMKYSFSSHSKLRSVSFSEGSGIMGQRQCVLCLLKARALRKVSFVPALMEMLLMEGDYFVGGRGEEGINLDEKQL